MRILTNKLFYNSNFKIRTLQAVNHIAVFYFLIMQGLKWSEICIAFLVYYFIFLFGINIGAHRYFSHKTFKLNLTKQIFLGYMMVLCTVGSTLAWAGMHRKHHRNSDTVNDPHTPRNQSARRSNYQFFRAYIGIWSSYIAELKYIRDLRREKLHKILHRYYFLILLVHCLAIFLIFGQFKYVVLFYCLPAILSFHAASLIVTLGHWAENKNSATNDYSQNSLLIHLLCAGEGLHHLHHKNPNLYYFKGNSIVFFDLPGFLINNFLKEKELAKC